MQKIAEFINLAETCCAQAWRTVDPEAKGALLELADQYFREATRLQDEHAKVKSKDR